MGCALPQQGFTGVEEKLAAGRGEGRVGEGVGAGGLCAVSTAFAGEAGFEVGRGVPEGGGRGGAVVVVEHCGGRWVSGGGG